MSEWPEVALESVLQPGGLSYGIVQPGSHTDDGVPIIRVTDLEGNTVRSSRPLRVSSELESAFARTRLVGGEVLVSIVGTVGRVAVVSDALAGWNVARAVAVLRPQSAADSQWIHYALLSDDAQRQMGIRKTDTVQATLNLRDLRSISLPWPDAVIRRRIAGLLGSLDNLIETNQQQLLCLRDVARTRFELAAQGGAEVRFGDVAQLVRQGVSRDRLSVGTPYLGLEHFATDGDGILSVGDAGAVNSNKSRFSAGDVLYGKLRPYFRKYDRPGFDGVCSTEIWVLRGTDPFCSGIVWSLVARPEFTEFATQSSVGTRMPRAEWNHVASMPVVVPPRRALVEVESHLEALWRACTNFQSEIAELTQARDELLPLLMSGRVRVREVA
jgi:type I restriction enzyme S subunit